MKLAIAAIALSIVGISAHASPLENAIQSVRETLAFNTGGSFVTPLEIKGRKGSARRGGYTSKGKGSHYVGGRK
jgi:hypothetical protein